MKCEHIGHGTPGQKTHVLPCRHEFCMDCIENITGLMTGYVFSCPECGNYSQYVNPRQALYGTDIIPEEPQRSDFPSNPLSVGDTYKNETYHNPTSENYQHDKYSRDFHDDLQRPGDTQGQIQRDKEEQYEERGRYPEKHNDKDTDLLIQNENVLEQREIMLEIEREKSRKQIFGDSAALYPDQVSSQEAANKQNDNHLHTRARQLPQCPSYDYHMDCDQGDYETLRNTAEQLKHGNVANKSALLPASNEGTYCKTHKTSMMYYFCHTCNELICAKCKQEKHIAHKYTTVDDNPNKNTVPNLCPTHNKGFSMFCRKCNVMLCRVCNDDKSSHNHYYRDKPTPLNDTVESLRCSFEKLDREISSSTAKHADQLEKIDSEMEKFRLNMEKVAKEVEEATRDAHDQLERNKEYLMLQLNETYMKKREALEAHKSKIKNICDRLSEVGDVMNNGIERVNTRDIPIAVTAETEVKNRLDELKKERLYPPTDTSELVCATNKIPNSPSYSAPVYLKHSW